MRHFIGISSRIDSFASFNSKHQCSYAVHNILFHFMNSFVFGGWKLCGKLTNNLVSTIFCESPPQKFGIRVIYAATELSEQISMTFMLRFLFPYMNRFISWKFCEKSIYYSWKSHSNEIVNLFLGKLWNTVKFIQFQCLVFQVMWKFSVQLWKLA